MRQVPNTCVALKWSQVPNSSTSSCAPVARTVSRHFVAMKRRRRSSLGGRWLWMRATGSPASSRSAGSRSTYVPSFGSDSPIAFTESSRPKRSRIARLCALPQPAIARVA
jgi:hypothetical protein